MSTNASTGGGTPASTGSAPASTGVVNAGTLPASSGFAWNDGWRDRLAAGSTDPGKELSQLERYESPEQIWRKARELEKRLSSGELRSTLRKDATPEEVARWRQENGIPAKAEEYALNLPAGKQAPKEDDPFLKNFLTQAHAANYTQAQVDQALSVFYSEVERQEQLIDEAENKAAATTEESLREQWGRDYRTNKSMAEALLARAPKGFRDRFMNGYLVEKSADGQITTRIPIRASVDAWNWLVQMEREINPAATVVPGAGGDVGKTIAAELIEIKKLMADKTSKYWKGPEAEQLQERYRTLLDADRKMKEKAGTTA